MCECAKVQLNSSRMREHESTHRHLPWSRGSWCKLLAVNVSHLHVRFSFKVTLASYFKWPRYSLTYTSLIISWERNTVYFEVTLHFSTSSPSVRTICSSLAFDFFRFSLSLFFRKSFRNCIEHSDVVKVKIRITLHLQVITMATKCLTRSLFSCSQLLLLFFLSLLLFILH